MKLKDLGIRKPVRSKRKRKLNRSTNTDLGRVRLSTCSIPSTPAILMANVRSLCPKMDELHAVVSVTKPEIICLTETWLNINIPDSAIQLGNYACMRRDRPDGHCGGVCVYVDSHLPCTRLSKFENTDIESVWLSVRPFRLPRTISIILVAVVYHPPNYGAEENSRLIDHLSINTEAFLAKHPDGQVIVTGDFNPTSTGIKAQAIKQ